MTICPECGSQFAPSPAWPDSHCGQCIADRVEASLLLALRVTRKPAKRATDIRVETKVDERDVRRRA